MLRKTSVPWREEPAKRLLAVRFASPVRRYLAIRWRRQPARSTYDQRRHRFPSTAWPTRWSRIKLRDRCAKAFYFDSLMTEEAFRSRILRNNLRGDKEVYADLTTNFPAAEEIIGGQDSLRLLPNFYARATGHIGITSLLVTENRRVALLYQGSTQRRCSGYRHLRRLGFAGATAIFKPRPGRTTTCARTSPTAWRARSAEETGSCRNISARCCANTMITGFFRWIDRCGKPEFV